jgi:hypothetical protein
MKHRTGKDFKGGGKYLAEPGTYHMAILDVTETPTKRDGTLINNAAFRATMSVLSGTVTGQEEKIYEATWFDPRQDAKDGGAFDTKKIDRFLLATGLIHEADKESEMDINLAKAAGRQVLIRLEKRTSKDGKEYLQLQGADIFHIDDPDCKSCPKKESALSLIPASLRKIGNQPPPKESPRQRNLADIDL